jgi:hypothetical protein
MSTYGRKPLDETHAAAWQEGHDDGFRAGVEAAATYLNGWHGYTISVATVANIRSLAPERAERGEGDDWGYKCPECGIDVCNHTVLAHHKLKAEIERLSPPAPPASGAPRCANGHVLGKGPHFCDACDCACAVHPSGTCDCECRRHPREAP